ncbi:hypothetical protein [Streptomyces spiramenti]|uniref:Uncharacterized protein n=1 Tax=Streptomyces spiramenti TaxID=2720606 RepID=A0ABX1AMT4_9ACTN|nr:hypothetical protein [Streptomyces spiramenti]NJP65928.1 hypothetical protein [Streptomyces spiramenti]
MYEDDVVELATEADSVRRQMIDGNLTVDAGDRAALTSVQRMCTLGYSAAAPENFDEYLALDLRRAARCSGHDPAQKPVGTVIRHAAELVEAGRNPHTVLSALASLVEPLAVDQRPDAGVPEPREERTPLDEPS